MRFNESSPDLHRRLRLHRSWGVRFEGGAEPQLIGFRVESGLGLAHHDREHVWLVDRADPLHTLEDLGRCFDVRTKSVDRAGAAPAAFVGEPAWRGEVVKGDEGHDSHG